MAATPSNKNLSIVTGIATFLRDGDSSEPRDLGDVSDFSISNDITKKDQYKHRGGRRTKYKTFTTQVGATIKFTMTETTAENISIFALGPVEENSDGTVTIDGLTDTDFTGILKVTGDNEEGTQTDWEGVVQFTPSGDFKFIQDNDDVNTIAVEASVQDDGRYPPGGRWTIREKA